MRDKLDELAAAGSARREAALEADAVRERARIRDARRATSALGVMAAREWWFVVGAIAFVSGLFAVVDFVAPDEHGGRVYSSLPVTGAGLAIGAALAGMIGVAQLLVRGSYQRELAWVGTLPFPIDGHMRLIAREGGAFKLHFTDASPDRDTLEKIVRGVSCATLALKNDKAPFKIELRFRDTTGRKVWRAWRGVVDQLLLPLHGRYPIAGVSFD